MFGRSGTSELQNLLGAGRAALKEVRTGSVPGSTVAVLEDGDEIENISPNTPPGSPDGIKQSSPQARPAPNAPNFEQNNTTKSVYEKICSEWAKIKNPDSGFFYFCENFVYINNQRHGYMHFKLYDYQKRVAGLLRNNRFIITRKFRQAGMSLMTGIYALWYSLVNPRMETLVLSIGMRESGKYLNEIREVYEALPQWLKGGLNNKNQPIKWMRKKALKDSVTELWLPNKSKIRSIPSSKAAGRGFSSKLLIIDEAAFIENIEVLWTGIYPTLANTQGQVFVVSTVNGVGGTGGWYFRTYKDAVEGNNDFVVAEMNYKEHPDYCDPKWESDMFRQLGQRKWDQEVIGKFLAAGNTYISAEHIEKMENSVEKTMKEKKESGIQWPKQEMGGKLLIWKEFVGQTELSDGSIKPAHHYAIGADCATGGGLDNSSASVFDVDTGEQVAEYKGKIPEDQFATILATLGYRYGTAVVAVELNSTAGGAVLMSLQKIQKYKRIYFGEDGKPGWNTNVRTRNIMIADLESNLYNESFKYNSLRFIDELKTFIVTKTGKIEHDLNCHDDCIFSCLIATSESVIRTARRASPKQPESVLMIEDSSQPDHIISRPVYSSTEENKEKRSKREAILTGTKHSAFLEKFSKMEEIAGENLLEWLMK
jgi:hypothetical protein